MQSKMNRPKKIITRQFQPMSKKDYSITETDTIPLWDRHEEILFQSAGEMLEWASNDKINFTLSDKVYDAMLDCLEDNVQAIIVATIIIENGAQIEVLIRRDNFQKILSAYVERLLNVEKYERLAEIKQQIQKYGLEI